MSMDDFKLIVPGTTPFHMMQLTQFQTEEMQRTWIARSEMDAELGRLWEAGEIDSQQAGEIKAANNERHQANLQGFLDAQQYETYSTNINRWLGRGK